MKPKRTIRRGLVFTMDFIASLFFFLVIILTLLWVWGETHRRISEYQEVSARHRRLLDVSTILVKTPGNPPDWHMHAVDPETVKALGLAREGNVLDDEKLETLEGADYMSLQEILGFGNENFTITVSDNITGSPSVLYSKGTGNTAKERLVVRRLALLNGTPVELKVEAYYNKK